MNKKIIILSLMNPNGTTGVQTHVNTFCNYLDSTKKKYQLITPFNAPIILVYIFLGLRRLLEPFFPTFAVKMYRQGHSYLLSLALRKVLKKEKDVVFYAQCPVSANVALNTRYSALQKVCLIIHFNISQADEWVGKNKIKKNSYLYNSIRSFEERLIFKVDSLVFVSKYMMREMHTRLPQLPLTKHTVIPNFVKSKNITQDKRYHADLISIGTLEDRKNQSYLLDIIAHAKNLGHYITVTIIGDGEDRESLNRKAASLNIGEQVTFMGFVANASSHILNHKAYIHVAKMENLPLVVIEAMSYGKPVIATPVGGVVEAFQDNIQGKYIPLDDFHSATDIVIKLLSDNTQLERLGVSARNHFTSNFEEKLIAHQLREFILS